MEIPSWFKEDWIDTDPKALGVYLALLFSILHAVEFDYSKDYAINYVKEEIAKKLTGKDALEAVKPAVTFLENLYVNEYSVDKGFKSGTTELLNAIEGKYYDRFRKACYKYLKKEYIERLEDKDKEDLIAILVKLKRSSYRLTTAGSIVSLYKLNASVFYELATGMNFDKLNQDEREKQSKRMENLREAIINSRILWFSDIIPAPFLEEEFLTKLTSSEESITVLPSTTEIRTTLVKEANEFEGKKPEWKILEEIVGKNLRSMGFNYELDKKLSARGGGTIEVDVWAWKRIGNTTFYAYASCKNWDKEVDRSVIDEEFGRTMQLIHIPHLKIFVAKKLTAPAKDAALADGFIVIELGEKVLTNNAQDIYNIIYNHLKELFIGIAPPELQRFAQLAREYSEKLRLLADEIEKISG